MRPIANFTIHAILAAALAALAASSAAAGQFDAFLELGSIRGETEAHKDQRSQHIELLSYSFGESRVSKVDGFTVKQGVKPYKLDRVFVKSWSTSGDAGSSPPPYRGGVSVASGDVNNAPVGGSETMTIGSGRAENAQATGKRMHKPLRAQMYYEAGSVTLSGRFPACRVGAAYPSAAIGHGNERYEMQDVIVSTCSPDSMSLNFKKVTVRGWNPETKEL
jgi:hypothetical protein